MNSATEPPPPSGRAPAAATGSVGADALVFAAALALGAVALALGRWRPRRVVVEGASMEPTLTAGDRLLVVRLRRLAIGDIVAVGDPRGGGRVMVKRVVGLDETTIAVEGDNRESSTDSRVFGPVARRAVVGRAVYRYHPPGRTGVAGLGRSGPNPGPETHEGIRSPRREPEA